MKASLTLSGSLAVISQVTALLVDHGFDVEVESGVAPVTPNVNAASPVLPTAAVTTPTPATAPSLPTAAPTPTDAVDLDATGLPWDERIHASTKTKKADGSWTKRKNLGVGVYDSVEAELRAKYPNGGAQSQPTPATTPPVQASVTPVAAPTALGVVNVAPVASEPVNLPPVQIAPESPVAAVQPVMQAVPETVQPVAPQPVAAPVGPPTNLHEMMVALGPLMQAGTITPEYMTQVIAETNTAWAAHLNGKVLNSVGDIAARPDLALAGYIWQVFQRDGKVA